MPSFQQKYGMIVNRHGVKEQQMLNDIAGVSLKTVSALTTAPHYVCTGSYSRATGALTMASVISSTPNNLKHPTSIGPLQFHHLMYSFGARHPYRPIVVRRTFARGSLNPLQKELRKRVYAGNGRDGGGDQEYTPWGWAPLPNAVTARSGVVVPKVPFEVSERRGLVEFFTVSHSRDDSVACDGAAAAQEVIKRMGAAHNQQPHQMHRGGGGFRHGMVEPWKMGVSVDPTVNNVTRTSVLRARRAVEGEELESCVDTERESVVVAARRIQLTIQVPEFATRMCNELNDKRATLQHSEGMRSLRRDAYGGASTAGSLIGFGLSEREHRVNLVDGDTCFIPRGWRYEVSRVLGDAARNAFSGVAEDDFEADALDNHYHTTTTGEQVVEAEEAAHRDDVSSLLECVAVKHSYRAFPALDNEEARLYMACEYATELGRFYSPNPAERRKMVNWK